MIDPITALATFNAACAVVKEAKEHAGDIASMFKGIGDMMSSKQELEKAIKQNPQQSDLELYAAHAQMEEQWEQIKTELKWTGHWDKYLKFCADRREAEKQERLAQVRAKQKKSKQIKEAMIIIGVIIGTLSAVGIIIWLLWLIKNKGTL